MKTEEIKEKAKKYLMPNIHGELYVFTIKQLEELIASQQQPSREKIIEVLPKLEKGDKIKLYGKETIVKGFDVHWNDALNPPQYEIILLTTGRGDPFYRSLDKIELTERYEEDNETKSAEWRRLHLGKNSYEQPQAEQDEIIKALSGEVIEDVQTFTTTKMPVEQSQPEQNKYGWDITAREAEENQKHDIKKVEETIFRKHIMEVLERHDKAWTQKDCVTITIPIQVYINAVKELSTPSEPKRKKRKLTPGRDFTMND